MVQACIKKRPNKNSPTEISQSLRPPSIPTVHPLALICLNRSICNRQLQQSSRQSQPASQTPKKTANLMAKKDNAVERRQIPRAKYLRDGPTGQPHRRQPQKTDAAAKEQSREIRHRYKNKKSDDYCAVKINRAQEIFLSIAVSQPAE